MKKTLVLSLAAASVAAAFSTASAADVRIYGRIDTGLVYQHFSGDSTAKDSFMMESGLNTASRWGIDASEKISDDLSVGTRMESRFASDTGALKGNRLFEGNASVKIVSKTWGELAAGRISGINSGSGPYDFQFYMDSTGGGAFGKALAPVKSTRMDNMLVYRSPMVSGFQATLQHSLKLEATQDGDESESAVDRFYAAGLRYNSGPLNLTAVYEQTIWGHTEKTAVNKAVTPTTDKKILTLGGSYRFEPVTVYLQAQYFDGVEKIDALKTDSLGALKGYGLYAGTQFWYGLSSWQTMLYWRDYSGDFRSGSGKLDASSIGLASKFLYRPSKTIDMYVGVGLAQWNRLDGTKKMTDKTVNLYSGVTKYF